MSDFREPEHCRQPKFKKDLPGTALRCSILSLATHKSIHQYDQITRKTDSDNDSGCCGGWPRFKETIVLAYTHSSIAMILPPGNDSTSGSKLPPIVWIRAAIRPALDSIKFIISLSYTGRSCYSSACLPQ